LKELGLMEKIKPSVPEVIREEEILNEHNPFKKTLRQIRLRCTLCEDRRIILGKGIGGEKDWDIVRRHMRIWHKLDIGEDIPIRLLSHSLLKKWIRQRPKGVDNNETTN